jgi:hypothetical protein
MVHSLARQPEMAVEQSALLTWMPTVDDVLGNHAFRHHPLTPLPMVKL